MGKLLHKLVNGIVPSWFTKIRASDASPKKLLPFFRGAMSSSSPRSPTNTEMMALIDKDPNSYYSASEDEEEKEKEPPAKATMESWSTAEKEPPAKATMERWATAAPSPTKTATSIVKKDDTDDAHHGHHHPHLVVEQKPHNPSDHHHHLPRSKRKSQCLHDEDQEDHGSIIIRWPFKRHKGEIRVLSSELPESLCKMVGNGSAVVKYSEDPHLAFWESMVEMIVGNGLWDMGNLEFLLYCYLSLNDPHLHDTIQRSFLQVLKDLERTS